MFDLICEIMAQEVVLVFNEALGFESFLIQQGFYSNA